MLSRIIQVVRNPAVRQWCGKKWHDNWALLQYDAKSGTLSYTIDAARLDQGKKHSLKIIVTDSKNNRTEYEGRFEY